MYEPHLTVWVGEISATEAGKLSKSQITTFQASVTALVAFSKARGLPVEDWSMFGDTRLTIDIPINAAAPATLLAYASDPSLPTIGRLVASRFADAPVAEVAALDAAIAAFGLSAEPA